MYTKQMFKLAEELMRGEEYRAALIRLMHNADKPNLYANQDFDRKQALATWFTQIIEDARY